jgi:Phage tail lysozyme
MASFNPNQVKKASRANYARDIQSTLMTQIMQAGYTRIQAAGIVGHGRHESANFDPKVVNLARHGDAGRSSGVFQWYDNPKERVSRRDKFINYAKQNNLNPRDVTTHGKFMLHELDTSENYTKQQLLKANSIEEATRAFMHFERPLGYNRNRPEQGHGYGSRLNFARMAYSGETTGVNPSGKDSTLHRGGIVDTGGPTYPPEQENTSRQRAVRPDRPASNYQQVPVKTNADEFGRQRPVFKQTLPQPAKQQFTEADAFGRSRPLPTSQNVPKPVFTPQATRQPITVKQQPIKPRTQAVPGTSNSPTSDAYGRPAKRDNNPALKNIPANPASSVADYDADVQARNQARHSALYAQGDMLSGLLNEAQSTNASILNDLMSSTNSYRQGVPLFDINFGSTPGEEQV